jgi:TRAP-type C4-dicarboxylate transport system substrate-binding protein
MTDRIQRKGQKEEAKMKRMVGVSVLAFLWAVVCSMGWCPAKAGAEAIKLSYANFPPAPTFPCVQMERWKAEVEKRTNGKVSIDTFPGGTLLDAKNMMDGVIAGQADIGCLCMAYQPGRFIVTNACTLPLDQPNAKAASLALWDLYNKYKPEEFAAVKVLTMFTTAPTNIMSKIPLRNLNDMKGVDLRAAGNSGKAIQAWGGNPVGMPMPETPEALQKGVVKGLFSSLETMKDFKFAETCRYVTITNTGVIPFAVVMNEGKWNALPDEVKKTIEDMAEEQSRWTGEYMDNQVQEAMAWSKETYQVEFIELSNEEKAKWDALAVPITGEWIAEAKGKGLPAEDMVADLKSFTEKRAR